MFSSAANGRIDVGIRLMNLCIFHLNQRYAVAKEGPLDSVYAACAEDISLGSKLSKRPI
jgi:hypothetical protein